mmetsp:Transcript_1794/g.2440  ORF Transcript_1794/g.2440 Transcript_1794/m.2440 type:complete len:590 (+) Transcript_1794:268-2037(+)|eukprot:CAMPEP_0117752918 /NCGR_PEP_ID=MMETSP0947-20121206/11909_1 /TAXON_ID=44440 /ORGANISM="Chattonella subsalsa, Strain CCMP2191" /LENGTH=589 /DNA_ID=CAMNT_0005571687 /DNA_START=265 /DNA_END=2034 /DNA_ORIENTATION=+
MGLSCGKAALRSEIEQLKIENGTKSSDIEKKNREIVDLEQQLRDLQSQHNTDELVQKIKKTEEKLKDKEEELKRLNDDLKKSTDAQNLKIEELEAKKLDLENLLQSMPDSPIEKESHVFVVSLICDEYNRGSAKERLEKLAYPRVSDYFTWDINLCEGASAFSLSMFHGNYVGAFDNHEWKFEPKTFDDDEMFDDIQLNCVDRYFRCLRPTDPATHTTCTNGYHHAVAFVLIEVSSNVSHQNTQGKLKKCIELSDYSIDFRSNQNSDKADDVDKMVVALQTKQKNDSSFQCFARHLLSLKLDSIDHVMQDQPPGKRLKSKSKAFDQIMEWYKKHSNHALILTHKATIHKESKHFMTKKDELIREIQQKLIEAYAEQAGTLVFDQQFQQKLNNLKDFFPPIIDEWTEKVKVVTEDSVPTMNRDFETRFDIVAKETEKSKQGHYEEMKRNFENIHNIFGQKKQELLEEHDELIKEAQKRQTDYLRSQQESLRSAQNEFISKKNSLQSQRAQLTEQLAELDSQMSNYQDKFSAKQSALYSIQSSIENAKNDARMRALSESSEYDKSDLDKQLSHGLEHFKVQNYKDNIERVY